MEQEEIKYLKKLLCWEHKINECLWSLVKILTSSHPENPWFGYVVEHDTLAKTIMQVIDKNGNAGDNTRNSWMFYWQLPTEYLGIWLFILHFHLTTMSFHILLRDCWCGDANWHAKSHLIGILYSVESPLAWHQFPKCLGSLLERC